MLSHIPRTVAVLGGALVLVSCSDSPLGNSGDELTNAEVEDLFGILVELSLAGPDSAQAGTFSSTVDLVDSCPNGFFSVRGSKQGEGVSANEYTVEGESEVDFFRCQTRSSEPYLIIDGDRFVRGRYTATRTDGGASYVAHLDGGLSFETSDGRSGRCAVDLRVRFDTGLGPQDLVVEGSICRVQGSALTGL